MEEEKGVVKKNESYSVETESFEKLIVTDVR